MKEDTYQSSHTDDAPEETILDTALDLSKAAIAFVLIIVAFVAAIALLIWLLI